MHISNDPVTRKDNGPMNEPGDDRPSLGKQMPAPLATDADTARHPAGPCAVCGRAVLRGHRYARLVPSGRLAHVPCVGRAATRSPQRKDPL